MTKDKNIMNIYKSVDMTTKKKLIVGLCLLTVFLLWYLIFGRESEHGQYDVGKSAGDYGSILELTRQQMAEKLSTCRRQCQRWDHDAPVIYAITPTYARAVQKAELTRLSQTLMHINTLHWIVIEDAPKKTTLVENLLARTNMNYTHLFVQTPAKYRIKGAPRGVQQRNAALRWLRENRSSRDKGVVYFADDDNSYSLQVFEEMRYTKEVSVWPVGLVGGLMVEKPILDTSGTKLIGWNSAWRPDRPFPIDMAGFAINLQHLLKKSKAYFSYNVSGGFQESHILQQITTRENLEPKADKCTQILVWHTRTEAPRLAEENKLIARVMRLVSDYLLLPSRDEYLNVIESVEVEPFDRQKFKCDDMGAKLSLNQTQETSSRVSSRENSKVNVNKIFSQSSNYSTNPKIVEPNENALKELLDETVNDENPSLLKLKLILEALKSIEGERALQNMRKEVENHCNSTGINTESIEEILSRLEENRYYKY